MAELSKDISTLKIVGMMVVGKNEAKRYLNRALGELSELCDKVAIWGDCVDPETEKVCTSYPNVIFYNHPESLWAKSQWKIKETLLKKFIAPLNPDWIAVKDADELYDKRFTREKAEEMANRNEVGYYFRVITLWGDEEHQRVDKGWQFWNIRFFKFLPERGLDYRPTPLHCGLAPIYAYRKGAYSDMILKHLGYVREEDQVSKRERYKKHDPKAIYNSWKWYKSMGEKPNIIPFNEDKFIKHMPEYMPTNHIDEAKRPMGKYYNVKNKAGKIYEVPEDQINYLKSKGFQVLDDIKSETKTKPKVEEIEIKEEAVKTRGEYEKNISENKTNQNEDEKYFICDICGKVCKSAAGLQAHKRLHKKKQQ